MEARGGSFPTSSAASCPTAGRRPGRDVAPPPPPPEMGPDQPALESLSPPTLPAQVKPLEPKAEPTEPKAVPKAEPEVGRRVEAKPKVVAKVYPVPKMAAPKSTCDVASWVDERRSAAVEEGVSARKPPTTAVKLKKNKMRATSQPAPAPASDRSAAGGERGIDSVEDPAAGICSELPEEEAKRIRQE